MKTESFKRYISGWMGFLDACVGRAAESDTHFSDLDNDYHHRESVRGE